jgi:hypothetical protein
VFRVPRFIPVYRAALRNSRQFTAKKKAKRQQQRPDCHIDTPGATLVREDKNDCGDQSAKPYERKREPKRILPHSAPPLAPTDAMLGPQADGDLTDDNAGPVRVLAFGAFCAAREPSPSIAVSVVGHAPQEQ